jgi:hypothetical protein
MDNYILFEIGFSEYLDNDEEKGSIYHRSSPHRVNSISLLVNKIDYGLRSFRLLDKTIFGLLLNFRIFIKKTKVTPYVTSKNREEGRQGF